MLVFTCQNGLFLSCLSRVVLRLPLTIEFVQPRYPYDNFSKQKTLRTQQDDYQPKPLYPPPIRNEPLYHPTQQSPKNSFSFLSAAASNVD